MTSPILRAVLLLSTLLGGCLSMSTYHTARPVSTDELEVGFTAGGSGSAMLGETFTSPDLEMTLRGGLDSNTDFGAKFFPLGIGFDINGLVGTAGPLALSGNPSLTAAFVTVGGNSALHVTGFLSVILDLISTRTFSLTVGLKPGFIYTSEPGLETLGATPKSGAYGVVGGFAGLKVRLADAFALMPEVNYYWVEDRSHAMFSAGVGIMF